MQKLLFVSLASSRKSIQKALMLATSLRAFGGELKDSPLLIMVPETTNGFSKPIQDELIRHEVKAIPFTIQPEVMKFPFAIKIIAAAYAEAIVTGNTEAMVWLDCDTIILKVPGEFLLPPGATLGYRPVHHKLIGPSWGEPLDPFWSRILHSCEVPEDRQFQMTTHTGENTRPYFNAGTFVIRPEKGLMEEWQSRFMKLYNLPKFQVFYQSDNRYFIFMHQAVFTGVMLRELDCAEMFELSPKINYPLHLHSEIPMERRPSSLNDLTTVRYENIFDTLDWQEDLSILQPLRPWLEAQLLL